MAKKKITVENIDITILSVNDSDYLSLTDLAKGASDREPSELLQSWLRNSSTLQYLEAWEQIHNENFKPGQMARFRLDAQNRAISVRPQKYIEQTNAIGLISKSGRYGGTWGHQDIAFNFAYWLSPSFQVYVAKEFLRLKQAESKQLGKAWNVRREIAKANYPLMTDAINKSLPANVAGTKKAGIHFASEADLLNTVIFGMTAKQWRATNPKAKGNIRDHASTLDLLILSNLEVLNANLIKWGSDQEQRYEILTEAAKEQRGILSDSKAAKRLK